MPFQDCFGHRERVNVPGTVNDQNWTFRLAQTIAELSADHASRDRLRSLAARHERLLAKLLA
jgi:4-alpha-glucanotransferase